MQCIQWLGFDWNTSFRKISSGYFQWWMNVFLPKKCLIYNSNVAGFSSQLLFCLLHCSHRVFIARYFPSLEEFRCDDEVTSQSSSLKANQLEAFKSLHGRCSSWPLNQLCTFFSCTSLFFQLLFKIYLSRDLQKYCNLAERGVELKSGEQTNPRL